MRALHRCNVATDARDCAAGAGLKRGGWSSVVCEEDPALYKEFSMLLTVFVPDEWRGVAEVQ